jgi:hypothetical protein
MRIHQRNDLFLHLIKAETFDFQVLNPAQHCINFQRTSFSDKRRIVGSSWREANGGKHVLSYPILGFLKRPLNRSSAYLSIGQAHIAQTLRVLPLPVEVRCTY